MMQVALTIDLHAGDRPEHFDRCNDGLSTCEILATFLVPTAAAAFYLRYFARSADQRVGLPAGFTDLCYVAPPWLAGFFGPIRFRGQAGSSAGSQPDVARR